MKCRKCGFEIEPMTDNGGLWNRTRVEQTRFPGTGCSYKLILHEPQPELQRYVNEAN